MTKDNGKIPWIYNEAYHPFYDLEQQYQISSEDIVHLEEHQQQYTTTSIPKDIYLEEHKL